jgi:Mg-chelatase subunit ChlD
LTDFALPLDFDRPIYLWAAALLPWFWWRGRRALVGLGYFRAGTVLLVRSIVWLLLVAACAEMQWVRTDERLTVIYLLDRSQSVPESARRETVDYVNRSIDADRGDDDAVGVIAFGREAKIEAPPSGEKLRLPKELETIVDPQYTDVAEAVKLALASFPEDSAKRIVLVSDGNQNVGDAYDVARRAVDQGIGIDVVPITYPTRGDVLVEKVSLPAVARRGEPFDLQVLVANTGPPGSKLGGTLEVVRRRGDETVVISREHVETPAGKRPFAVRQTLTDADFYTYEARFHPDDKAHDAQVLNNSAVNFTQVEGAGRILLIENFQKRGRHTRLVEALRKQKLEVTVIPSNRLFESPAELIPYDTVILADVPRAGGSGVEDLVDFSDAQIRMLTTNVHEMGCGLVMLGGPNSFGAGGWTNTPIEEAMPVDFQIKNVKVIPSGALAIIVDSSGSMDGEKLEIAKAASIASVRVLGPNDFISVLSFDSIVHDVVPMQRMQSVRNIEGQLRRLQAGGGTNMRPALDQGYGAIGRAQASVKHVIVMTDGQTEGSGYEATVADMRKKGITTSCVSIGEGAADPLLEGMARAGGGKFYKTTKLNVVPRIFTVEAQRIARPLIYEKEQGFAARKLGATHEIMRGIESAPPALTGFVMTSTKQNSLVQVLMDHPQFAAEGTGALAAAWTYGLGRTAVWTSDTGQAWASEWNTWGEFDEFLTGLVRWTMRPPSTGGRYVVHSDVSDGMGRIVVTAVDDAGEYLNLLDPQGTVLDPHLGVRPIKLEQTAPGRYAATFDASDVGSYFIVVRPGPGQPTLRTGLNVSYSAEFRDREPNTTLLASLAGLEPTGGSAGLIAPALAARPEGETAASAPIAPADFFRHDLPKATGRRDLWPELVLAALCLFVADVFLRRVAFDLARMQAWAALRIAKIRKRGYVPSAPYMERLRSRKDEVAREVDRRRTVLGGRAATASSAATPSAPAPPWPDSPPPLAPAPTPPPADELPSYVPPPDAQGPETQGTGSKAPPPLPPRRTEPAPTPAPEEDDYTSRLLKAKRNVKYTRDTRPPGSPPDHRPDDRN